MEILRTEVEQLSTAIRQMSSTIQKEVSSQVTRMKGELKANSITNNQIQSLLDSRFQEQEKKLQIQLEQEKQEALTKHTFQVELITKIITKQQQEMEQCLLAREEEQTKQRKAELSILTETILQQQSQQINAVLAAVQTQALHQNMQPEPNTDSTIPESIQEDPMQPNHATTTPTQTSQEENI